MNYCFKYCILLFFLLFSHFAVAQYFEESGDYFHKLAIESGLSNNKVNCIVRDQTGFVWIGTGSGLSRFDGSSIVVIGQDVVESDYLRDEEIFDLYEDEKGMIWIGSEKGLYRFNYMDESILYYPLFLNSKRTKRVRSIEPESDSTLWIGTSNGLLLFDVISKVVIAEYTNQPYEPHTISSNDVQGLCDTGDELWVSTNNGINVLDKQQKIFERHMHDASDPFSIATNRSRKLIQDSDGDIWIGSEDVGLICYKMDSKKYLNYNTSNSNIPHNDVRKIFEIGNGKFWLATNGGGLSLFDKINKEFINYTYDPLNINGLSNNSIYTVLEDYDGILWLGFYAGGVNYSTSKITDFKFVSHYPGNDNSLCESNSRSLFLDSDDNLWVGTLGGLSFYDHDKRIFKSYVHDPENDNSLSFNTVTSICEDHNKNIWIGTYSGGVNLLNPKTDSFIRFSHDKSESNSISSDNVYRVIEDSLQNILVVSASGLDLYNPKDNSWRHLLNGNLRDILLLSKEEIVLASHGGLVYYNINSKKYKVFSNRGAYQVFTKIVKDVGSSKIWFSSQGSGFGYFDPDTEKFTNFTTEDGLANNIVSSIENYGEDHLWLSTYKGVTLFNKETHKFANYGMADGLKSLEFYPRSSERLPDGTFAFGGSNGIVIFDPEAILQKKIPSKLRFSNLKIDGNTVEIGVDGSPLKKNISLTDQVILRYSQNDFSFEFIDINFKSRRIGDFAYKLENYMSDWSEIGNQNSVGFTNMDPDDYTLRIRKLGRDAGEGYQDEISMAIKIIPPFWMTWYFYLLITITFILMLYLYSKYTLISISQKNKIRLKNLEYEKNREFNALRMKFFTYISHELRTPLSLIVDPLNKLVQVNKDSNNLKYLKLIESNSNRLMKLVNQILDFRKLENDTLNLEISKNNIVEVLSKICADFDVTAKSENIEYRLDCDIDPGFEGWIDSDKLEKILYNLLTNAFKFANEKGEVIVHLKLIEPENKISLSVSDNGYGIHPEKLKNIFDFFYSDEKLARTYKGGVGIGLSYVKRLVDLHHGTITVDSEVGKGTIFTILIPVSKDEYNTEELVEKIGEKQQVDSKVNVFEDIPEKELPVHGTDVPLVLIVEDETDLRKYLSMLIGEKFRTEQAVNGKDALDKLQGVTPDLILCDNVMPVMNGVQFCNQLKSSEEFSHIPFIFLSAWNSDDFKLKGLKVGANDYMSKPFDSEVLLTKVSNIIDKRLKFKEIANKLLKVKPNDVKIETSDERFILKAQEVIEKNMDNIDFTTKQFEEQLSMSHSVVYRKIKSLTGLSANEFIREYKIQRAAQIIQQDKKLTVMEVSLMVGFNDQKYFSRCFKKIMGVSPSEYNR